MNNFLKYNVLTKFLYSLYLRYLNRSVSSYVFVATTGRSGSNTLCNIFDDVESICNLHEPYPVMFSDKSDFTKQELTYLSAEKRKLNNIFQQAANKKIYIETSHLFIKNFSDAVLERIPQNKIKIIHLKRDAISVAKSFYLIGSIPGETLRGKKYLLDPKQQENCIKLPELYSDELFGHDFYKCLWYWFEIEARTKKLQQLLPASAWYSLETSDLNDENSIKSLTDFLVMNNSDQEKVIAKTGIRKNTKTTEKKQETLVYDKMYESFTKLLKNKGYGDLL